MKRSPEKHIAAMAMKKTNSEIIARRALDDVSNKIKLNSLPTHRTTILFEIAKKASLHMSAK